MAEKSRYNFRVEPQDVDFTLRATIPSLGSAILNTAGADAHGKARHEEDRERKARGQGLPRPGSGNGGHHFAAAKASVIVPSAAKSFIIRTARKQDFLMSVPLSASN